MRALSLFTAANVSVVGASTLYIKSRLDTQDEEFEARMDEIEGTFRGHIGLIEDFLDRLGEPQGISVATGKTSKKKSDDQGSTSKDDKSKGGK